MAEALPRPGPVQLRILGSLGPEGGAASAADLIGQPKAMALLVYLVLARPKGFHQRDRLVGLLWRDLDQERARASLRKTLHRVRQVLGDDVIVSQGAEALGIAPGAVQCDAVAFHEAVDTDALTEALELHTGDLLPGFFVPGSGDFENWLDHERARLRERAVDAAWRLVERFAADRQLTNASRLARLVARLAPTDERMLRRVLTMLSRLGDRAGAIEVYTRFTTHLWTEFETKPSLDTQRLIEAIQTNSVI